MSERWSAYENPMRPGEFFVGTEDGDWEEHPGLSGPIRRWRPKEIICKRSQPAERAYLIAAAPDLLEALKRIEHDWDGEPEDMQEARAAIAKTDPSTGEGES